MSDRDRGSSHSGAVTIRHLSIHGNVGMNFCLWRPDVLPDVNQLGLWKTRWNLATTSSAEVEFPHFVPNLPKFQIQTCCNHPSKIDLISQKCCRLDLQTPNPYYFHLYSKFTKLNKFEPRENCTSIDFNIQDTRYSNNDFEYLSAIVMTCLEAKNYNQ